MHMQCMSRLSFENKAQTTAIARRLYPDEIALYIIRNLTATQLFFYILQLNFLKENKFLYRKHRLLLTDCLFMILLKFIRDKIHIYEKSSFNQIEVHICYRDDQK